MLWFCFLLFACFISYILKYQETFLGIISQDPAILSYRQAVLISSPAGGVAHKVTFGWCGNKTWG